MASPPLSCLPFTLSVSLSRLLDSFRRAVLQSWPASFLLNPAGSQAPNYYYHITGGIRSRPAARRDMKTAGPSSDPTIILHSFCCRAPLSRCPRLVSWAAWPYQHAGLVLSCLVWSGLAEHRNSGSGGGGAWGVHPSDAGGQQPFYHVHTSLFPSPTQSTGDEA